MPQERPHDAFDDALVLTGVLTAALQRARERDVWLPVRPVTRRRWPNGRVTHDELRPLKALASRMPCPYLNPGRYVPGRPLVQGMRVALAAEVGRTHEELLERILHAGLAYSDHVDPETSLVVCNETAPGRARATTRCGWGSGGFRRDVHGLCRIRRRRHQRAAIHRRGGRAVRLVLKRLRAAIVET